MSRGTIYIGAQFLFRSRDHGQSWERISPDLTTNDPEKQKQEESGGVTVDNSDAEMHTTIYSISESPRERRTYLGGHRRRQRPDHPRWRQDLDQRGGQRSEPAEASWVSWVEAEPLRCWRPPTPLSTGTLLATWTVRLQDHRLRQDLDAHRRAGANGVRGYAHVIKEDTVSPQLLFLGTEFGLWISLDGGSAMGAIQGRRFPECRGARHRDPAARQSDLVLATHGRGIWIIDDITPLRQAHAGGVAQGRGVPARRSHTAAAQPARRMVGGDATFFGPNPPDAAMITYYQKKRHIFGE